MRKQTPMPRRENIRDKRYDFPVSRPRSVQPGNDPYGSGRPGNERPGNGRPGNSRPETRRLPPRPPARRKKKRSSGCVLPVILLVICLLCAGFLLHSCIRSGFPGIGTPNAGGTDASGTAAVSDAENISALPNTAPIVFSDDTSAPLYGKVILLDAGHGGTDSGCLYPTTNPKLVESAINLDIAERTKVSLEKLGASVIMLRDDDSWISLYNRLSLAHLYCLQYADQTGADTLGDTDRQRLISELCDTIDINSDTISSGGMGIMVGTGVGPDLGLLMDLESGFKNVLYLSVHINSNPYASLHGTQVYYVTDDSVIASEENTLYEDPSLLDNPDFPVRSDWYGRNGARNELFAQSLYDAIVGAEPDLETNVEKPIVADNYAVLREHNLTGALVEVGFITSKKDRAILSESASLGRIAAGIANGCLNFFASAS